MKFSFFFYFFLLLQVVRPDEAIDPLMPFNLIIPSTDFNIISDTVDTASSVGQSSYTTSGLFEQIPYEAPTTDADGSTIETTFSQECYQPVFFEASGPAREFYAMYDIPQLVDPQPLMTVFALGVTSPENYPLIGISDANAQASGACSGRDCKVYPSSMNLKIKNAVIYNVPYEGFQETQLIIYQTAINQIPSIFICNLAAFPYPNIAFSADATHTCTHPCVYSTNYVNNTFGQDGTDPTFLSVDTSIGKQLSSASASYEIEFTDTKQIKGLIVVPNAVNPATDVSTGDDPQNFRVQIFETTGDIGSMIYDSGFYTQPLVTDLTNLTSEAQFLVMTTTTGFNLEGLAILGLCGTAQYCEYSDFYVYRTGTSDPVAADIINLSIEAGGSADQYQISAQTTADKCQAQGYICGFFVDPNDAVLTLVQFTEATGYLSADYPYEDIISTDFATLTFDDTTDTEHPGFFAVEFSPPLQQFPGIYEYEITNLKLVDFYGRPYTKTQKFTTTVDWCSISSFQSDLQNGGYITSTYYVGQIYPSLVLDYDDVLAGQDPCLGYTTIQSIDLTGNSEILEFIVQDNATLFWPESTNVIQRLLKGEYSLDLKITFMDGTQFTNIINARVVDGCFEQSFQSINIYYVKDVEEETAVVEGEPVNLYVEKQRQLETARTIEFYIDDIVSQNTLHTFCGWCGNYEITVSVSEESEELIEYQLIQQTHCAMAQLKIWAKHTEAVADPVLFLISVAFEEEPAPKKVLSETYSLQVKLTTVKAEGYLTAPDLIYTKNFLVIEGYSWSYQLPDQTSTFTQIEVTIPGKAESFFNANSDGQSFFIKQDATLGLTGIYDITLKVTWQIDHENGTTSYLDGEYIMKIDVGVNVKAQEEYENLFDGIAFEGVKIEEERENHAEFVTVGNIGYEGTFKLYIPETFDYLLDQDHHLHENILKIQYFPDNMDNRANFIGWKTIDLLPHIVTIQLEFETPSIVTTKDFMHIKVQEYSPEQKSNYTNASDSSNITNSPQPSKNTVSPQACTKVVKKRSFFQDFVDSIGLGSSSNTTNSTTQDNSNCQEQKDNSASRNLQSSEKKAKHIKPGLEIIFFMVPQIPKKQIEAAEEMSDVLTNALTTSFIVFTIGKFVFGFSLKKVWSLLLALQIMLFIILNLSQPKYPALILYVGQQIDNLLKLKIIPYDDFIKENIPDVEISKDLMDQMVFILIPLGIVLFLGLIMLAAFLCRSKKIKVKIEKMKRKMLWNSILRSMLVGYIGYATTVSLTYPLLTKQKSSKIITFGVLCFIVLFLPTWMYFFLRKTTIEEINSDSWKSKFGTITTGLQADYRRSRYFYVYLLLRRLGMAAVLQVPFAQTQIAASMSLALIFVLMHKQPFSDFSQNDIEWFNELMIYLSIQCSMATTEYTETLTNEEANPVKVVFGYQHIMIVMMVIVVNQLGIVISEVNKRILKCKRRKYQKKRKGEFRYLYEIPFKEHKPKLSMTAIQNRNKIKKLVPNHHQIDFETDCVLLDQIAEAHNNVTKSKSWISMPDSDWKQVHENHENQYQIKHKEAVEQKRRSEEEFRAYFQAQQEEIRLEIRRAEEQAIQNQLEQIPELQMDEESKNDNEPQQMTFDDVYDQEELAEQSRNTNLQGQSNQQKPQQKQLIFT